MHAVGRPFQGTSLAFKRSEVAILCIVVLLLRRFPLVPLFLFTLVVCFVVFSLCLVFRFKKMFTYADVRNTFFFFFFLFFVRFKCYLFIFMFFVLFVLFFSFRIPAGRAPRTLQERPAPLQLEAEDEEPGPRVGGGVPPRRRRRLFPLRPQGIKLRARHGSRRSC